MNTRSREHAFPTATPLAGALAGAFSAPVAWAPGDCIRHTYRKPPHQHRWAIIEELFWDAQGRLCAWVRWNITGRRVRRRLDDRHICRCADSHAQD